MANGVPDRRQNDIGLETRMTVLEKALAEMEKRQSKNEEVQSERHSENKDIQRKDKDAILSSIKEARDETKRDNCEILNQAKLTNGRVTVLEQWRYGVTLLKEAAHPYWMAGAAIFTSVTSAVILYFLLKK
jgi:hypothetical protein